MTEHVVTLSNLPFQGLEAAGDRHLEVAVAPTTHADSAERRGRAEVRAHGGG